MAKLGDVRVNSMDYDGDVVIEQYGYHGQAAPCWAVPAWEERGDADLAGPFATRAEANAAVERWESYVID